LGATGVGHFWRVELALNDAVLFGVRGAVDNRSIVIGCGVRGEAVGCEAIRSDATRGNAIGREAIQGDATGDGATGEDTVDGCTRSLCWRG